MHTVTIIEKKEVPVKYLRAQCGVRYWEDASVNDIDDEDGTLIPHRKGDNWDITIDLDTGKIENWPADKKAYIHYKVCDAGTYQLLNEQRELVKEIDGYVPKILSPGGSGYGDYVIMDIDETGQIAKWRVDLESFDDVEGEW